MSDNNDAVREALARRVAELEEREQELAAHVERLTSELEDRSMTNDPRAASEHYWQLADAIEPYVLDGSLTASVVESHEFLLDFWVAAGKPKGLVQLKAQWQAEALEWASGAFIAEQGDFTFERAEVSEWLSETADELRRQSQEPAQ